MKTKPKYNVLQNIYWMFQISWKHHKIVPLLCIVTVALELGLKLTQLFISPEILARVEQTAPLSELLKTIILFTLALFLLQSLKAYVNDNTQFGRVAVRNVLSTKFQYKVQCTAYPNALDPEIQKMQGRADTAVTYPGSGTQRIWATLSNLLTNVMGFLLYLALLSDLDPVMILVAIVTSVIGFFTTLRANHWAHDHRKEDGQYTHQFHYLQYCIESPTLAKDIRIFGLGDWLTDVQNSAMNLILTLRSRHELVKMLSGIADVLLNFLRNGVAYFYLIRLALLGELAASEFLLYFTAVGTFTSWIAGILKACSTLHEDSLDISTLREYLELKEPFLFEEGAPIPQATEYELRLENVSFRYPQADKDTIQHMNLTIRPGEKLAIVGLNGAGKTTLVKLLCGLLDPTEGKILLNGQDIREFNRREYYGLFSAVFQDFSVLDATVAENVSQSISDIDTDRVAACLEKAGLTEDIAALPKGMDTHMGREIFEDGVLLSGGQMQRLMLARALYKNGPLLFLDEPTAALDPVAENNIYLKYNEMTAGKTALFISHRLASTRFCDRIIFLAQGTITEEGTHEELLARKGEYADLFQIQSRYYQEGREF